MTILKGFILTAALITLAACASVTPEAELETGVDEYGAYTLVAVEDSSAGLSPTASFTPVGRRIELRAYSDGRYSSWLIVSSGNNIVNGAGTLGLTFSRGSQTAYPGKRFDMYLTRWKTWNGNTGAVRPPFTPERVCARIVYERFASNNQNGGSDRIDDGVSYVCANR